MLRGNIMGLFHLLCIQRRALAALLCVTQGTNAAALGISAAKTKHMGVWDPCTPNIPSTCIHCLQICLVCAPTGCHNSEMCCDISEAMRYSESILYSGYSGEYFPRQKAFEYRVWLKKITSEQFTGKRNIKAFSELKVEILVPPSEAAHCGSLTQQPGWEEISDNLFCVGTEVHSPAKVPSENNKVSFTFPSSTFHPYESCFKLQSSYASYDSCAKVKLLLQEQHPETTLVFMTHCLT